MHSGQELQYFASKPTDVAMWEQYTLSSADVPYNPLDPRLTSEPPVTSLWPGETDRNEDVESHKCENICILT